VENQKRQSNDEGGFAEIEPDAMPRFEQRRVAQEFDVGAWVWPQGRAIKSGIVPNKGGV
jgi:hypothetical protein